ncbi:MAG: DUF1826 domain-containing protein [Pseudomonadota bacterium]
MRLVTSDQPGDFSAIYDEDVELVSVARPQAASCAKLAQQLIDSRQAPRLRWVQSHEDPTSAERALPPGINGEVRTALLDEIAEASDLLGELIDCEAIGVRLETLNAPMCPKFHVDHVPCRLLITLSGAGTEWIQNSDVDWAVFANRDENSPPVRANGEIRQLTTGDWSLLKGGAWNENFEGVVHRSPHSPGERLLLSLEPIG